MAQSASAPCAAVVITTNNHNSSKQNATIFRWPSVLDMAAAVCPAVGCMLCVGESMRLLEHIAGSDSSPFPCYFKISDIKFILTVLYFNRATINAQRICAGYLRLFAWVICPWGRGLIVRRVLCA